MANNVHPKDALSLGFYHFHPGWTTSYGDSYEKKIEEFKDVMRAGYTNCVLTSFDNLLSDEFWEVIFENEAHVWVNVWTFFDSGKQNIDEWICELDKVMQTTQRNPERWERVIGFHFDEPVWRGQSNADFLMQTKTLRQRYNKRVFPVFATGEFIDSEGNAMQLKMDAANMKKLIPEALEYVTDVAFDSYSVDVRFGFGNGNYINKINAKFPTVVDGKSYYDELTKHLVKLCGHDVNVWYFPCSYTTNLWRGGRVDEGYCIGHLEYFCELLMRQKYQGGIMLYTYKNNARTPEELGLQSHLVVTDKDGNQKLRPEFENWEIYSECLKNACKKFRETKANIAEFN